MGAVGRCCSIGLRQVSSRSGAIGVLGTPCTVTDPSNSASVLSYRKRPIEARAALATVRRAAREGLAELRGTLVTLRTGGTDDAQTSPQPGLADLTSPVPASRASSSRAPATNHSTAAGRVRVAATGLDHPSLATPNGRATAGVVRLVGRSGRGQLV